MEKGGGSGEPLVSGSGRRRIGACSGGGLEVEEIVIGTEEPVRRCGFMKMLLLLRRRRLVLLLVGEVIKVIVMKRHRFRMNNCIQMKKKKRSS